MLRRCIHDKNLRQKKPRWVGGVRVIVVVANSVSATAYGLWWIIVVVVTSLLIVVYSSSYDPLTSGFDSLY